MKAMPRKPIQVLLENFVLHCIGALSPEQYAETGTLVAKAFGPTEDWPQTVIDHLGLTPAVTEQIAGLWQQTKALAEQKNTPVAPGEYAATVVEENFADLVEMLASGT